MSNENMPVIAALTKAVLGDMDGQKALDALHIAPALLAERGPTVTRAAFAMAMTVSLFDNLLRRVPSGAAYVADMLAQGRRISFDHGALRTIRLPDGPTGALPGGEDAFARIFVPLGYRMATIYPLDRLKMTGRAYTHADHPTPSRNSSCPNCMSIASMPTLPTPQSVCSALRAIRSMHRRWRCWTILRRAGPCRSPTPWRRCPTILSAFDRQHDAPDFADYQLLLSRSNEAAWIATEGNAFNHATDRVADVAALADRLRADDHPIKDRLEISATGRVRQTALRADSVERRFADGQLRAVPGSFFEFISRDIDPATGQLDLAFDTGNATGIFAMTRAGA